MRDANRIRIQVPPEHYAAATYLTPDRERSFSLQEQFVTRAEPIVEVGIGPGTLTRRLRATGCRVISVDFDPRLRPDVAASVTHLPFRKASVPTVAAFEVLEHVPLVRLRDAVKELCRVAARYVVVSVPRKTDRIRTFISLRVLRRPWRDPEHHWELGLFVSKRAFVRLFADHGFVPVRYDATHPTHRFFVFTSGPSSRRLLLGFLRNRWSSESPDESVQRDVSSS